MNIPSQNLSFVTHFGEMASKWGFNRTVGQMLALLVIEPDALNADDIAASLHISRGNVSMGLKELQSWRLIRIERKQGDRKDYYTTNGNIWDMAMIVFEERRKREIDPTLSVLRTALLNASDSEQDDYSYQQMKELLELLETMTHWGEQLQQMSPAQLKGLLAVGSSVGKVINFISKNE